MLRLIFLLAACLCLALPDAAQSQEGEKDANQNQPPPRSERSKEAGESSSRDTLIDLSPPSNDAKDHPNSTVPPDDTDGNTPGDVQEFHPFDPHRALKDIEVGDFYFKKKNYRAALERYREALFYKPNDAMANFKMATAFEKLARLDEAVEHYEEYLRILPNGPQAEEARKALEKIKTSPPPEKNRPGSNRSSNQAPHRHPSVICHPERSRSFRRRRERKSKDPYSRHCGREIWDFGLPTIIHPPATGTNRTCGAGASPAGVRTDRQKPRARAPAPHNSTRALYFSTRIKSPLEAFTATFSL